MTASCGPLLNASQAILRDHHLTTSRKTDLSQCRKSKRDLTSQQTSFVSVFSIPQIQVSTQDIHSSIFPSFVSKQGNRPLSGSFETSGEREGSLSSSLFELFLRFREESENRIKTVCELKNSLNAHSSSDLQSSTEQIPSYLCQSLTKLCETFQMISRNYKIQLPEKKSNCSFL